MTHHPLMCKVVEGLDFESVCEFGNQRYKGPGDFNSVKEWYEHLGCTDYVALDVNKEQDAIIADLNYPVDVGRTFDLVTNNGTGEHIFNQLAVFENAHNLSHKYMVHILPMIPWLNHGFFNYHPLLFRDLATANNYKADIFLGNRWGETARLKPKDLFPEKNARVLEKAADVLMKRGGVFVVAVFKKAGDDEFRMPFQGEYRGTISDEKLKKRYK